MPHQHQADESSKLSTGASGKVAWFARSDGRFYDYERAVAKDIVKKREEGVTVFAQGHYYALQEAARELQLSPEHIMLGKPEPTYRVYVIECTARTGRVTIHVGIAKDVAKRVHQHRTRGVKATRGKDVRWLGNSERMDQTAALQLEIELKKLRPVQKRAWAIQQEQHG